MATKQMRTSSTNWWMISKSWEKRDNEPRLFHDMRTQSMNVLLLVVLWLSSNTVLVLVLVPYWWRSWMERFDGVTHYVQYRVLHFWCHQLHFHPSNGSTQRMKVGKAKTTKQKHDMSQSIRNQECWPGRVPSVWVPSVCLKARMWTLIASSVHGGRLWLVPSLLKC